MTSKTYHTKIERQVNKEFDLAARARKNGTDATDKPEPYLAKDVAEKVEGLIEVDGLADTIRKLSHKFKNEEEIALHLAKEIIAKEPDREKAAERAIRATLAFLTQGAVSAPLEGIAKVKIKRNPDDSEYLAIYYAGPIRAAGGTAEGLSVIMADYIRKQLGLGRYQATLQEIGRYVEEIQWYHRHVHLQYFPSEKEIQTIVRNVPVCIDGEPTEKFEVANYRDLGRVDTNRVRGGMCLVLAEGIAQKAPKLLKRLKPIDKMHGLDWGWLSDLIIKPQEPTINTPQNLPGFEWLVDVNEEAPLEISQIIELTKEHAQWAWADEGTENAPPENGSSKKYIQEIPAGRPVFSHPGRKGGFRLRYGRTRASGHSAVAVHPATMHVVDNFIAIGTQIRLELPGKAAIVTPCDTIDGPVVLLDDGEVRRLDSVEEVEVVGSKIKSILQLGDILISLGDFLENNHTLLPGAYCEEWWAQEVLHAACGTPKKWEKYLKPPYSTPPLETALEISKKHNIPLHPKHTFLWDDLSVTQLKKLAKILSEAKQTKTSLELENSPAAKELLETLNVFHKIQGGKIIVKEHAAPLLSALPPAKETAKKIDKLAKNKRGSLQIVSEISGISLREKNPTYVGARMGRPEKAKPRKMVPAPHALFPTGVVKGRVRDLKKAAEIGCTPEVAKFFCPACKTTGMFPLCTKCGARTSLVRACKSCGRTTKADCCPACGSFTSASERRRIDLTALLENAEKKIGLPNHPPVKGVLGMTSRDKIPEALEKGILRAVHGLYAFKDGTIRFDSTNAPLTHFKPNEIGTSVEKIKKLGYTQDINGEPITHGGQVIELRPQDIILSSFGEDSAPKHLFQTSKFVDNLLEKYYELTPFYKLRKESDLIGHLVIALAPHTSTGSVGRIIGFTKARVCYAHPAFHAAKRRDCDGDEDAVMLLLDALLNFSRAFLPASRGGRMDAPLVITTKLDLHEVDDEVYDVDIHDHYPLEFYETAVKGANPGDIGLRTVSSILNTDTPFSNWRFTHNTTDINTGPVLNRYTEGEMKEKLERQLALAETILAVDEKDVAERIIRTHFIPDMKGNLRTFSRQKVRCTKCNAKYRRPPLRGVCLRCGGNLTLTVHRGTVVKYLGLSKKMAAKYNINPYLSQQIGMLELSINSIFKKEPQSTLEAFSGEAQT